MYQYTECGLDYVWLTDGFDRIDTGYGEAVSVRSCRALHQVIALDVVEKKPLLSGDDLRFLRGNMDKTQAEYAFLVGKDAQTVARWEKSAQVPDIINVVARLIYLNHLGRNPSYIDMVYLLDDLKKTDSGEPFRLSYAHQESAIAEDWRLAA